MRRLILLAAIATVAVAAAPSAVAKTANCHKAKTCTAATVDPTFACDGTNCTYTATGLPANTDYQLSVAFTPTDGSTVGCHLGVSALPTDGSGVYSYSVPEARVKCSNYPGATGGSGNVTAWLRDASSAFFNDPAVPGTEITVAVS